MSFLKKVWQAVSFLFVLYGFYLLFLFLWDTTVRLNEELALPLSLSITVIALGVSGIFWARKRIKRADTI